MKAYRFVALDEGAFQDLFGLDDAALARQGVRRVVADSNPGFPCRISLEDAAVGEEVLLLSFTHHESGTPYRSGGPIFVRPGAVARRVPANQVPAFLSHRTLSLRGYDAEGTLRTAAVCAGADVESTIGTLFGDPSVADLHVHNAATGCYLCRVEPD